MVRGLWQWLFHFERRHQRLAAPDQFARRFARNLAVALGMVGVSLAIGIAGYMAAEGMGLVDAFANASMILSGMGPLSPLHSTAGKIFAGLYALFSGIVLVLATGVLLAPIAHRALHDFHLEDGDRRESEGDDGRRCPT